MQQIASLFLGALVRCLPANAGDHLPAEIHRKRSSNGYANLRWRASWHGRVNLRMSAFGGAPPPPPARQSNLNTQYRRPNRHLSPHSRELIDF